jgi:two-component system response regulator NreC
MINILLVEDHNLVRDGIKNLLINETDFYVADTAANGKEALGKLEAGLDVSLVLTDITMPELNGFELTKALREKYPDIKVIILTMLSDENSIQQAFSIGASGYLLKNIGVDELVFALKHVSGGNTYICSNLSMKLLEKNSKFYSTNSTVNSEVSLSQREIEVLKMVGQGLTNSEIADKMFTSKRTVEGHRQKLLNKTGTKNTASLIRYAIQYGFLS